MYLRRLLLFIILLPSLTGLACTSAIISGSRTASGRPLLWKHRDTSNADSRVAYIAATDSMELSFVAIFNANDYADKQAWIGMNSAGFAIMNTASYNLLPPGTKSADREGYVMSMALRKCKTVDDFHRMLEHLPRPMGVEANFGVIDALGNGAFFETGNKSFKRYDLSEADNGILVRTNYSYSGYKNRGSGFVRHDNAVQLLTDALSYGPITPELLTEQLSRRFYRHDDKRDHINDSIRIIADMDFIPRYTSVATVVIEGMLPADTLPSPQQVADQYIMWTGLGYPPCAEIRPVWCRPDGVESGLTGQGKNNHAPLADKAQQMRLDVFSSRPKEGKKRFIDLNKLSNPKGTGYLQQIIPINLETYRRYRNR